jgi:hypothetical protein
LYSNILFLAGLVLGGVDLRRVGLVLADPMPRPVDHFHRFSTIN